MPLPSQYSAPAMFVFFAGASEEQVMGSAKVASIGALIAAAAIGIGAAPTASGNRRRLRHQRNLLRGLQR